MKIKDAVVVVTGASSGVGRAAAEAFAREGARVVLAARDASPLEDAARVCEALGSEALAVPTDVRDASAVDELAHAAVRRFGRIDVWVNDAAVYMMGKIEDCPPEAARLLLETNVLGIAHGMRAALRQFRRQSGKGILIGVGSVAGKVSYCQAGMYCASKHAVHALHGALRQEVLGTNIHVCLIVPATIDTPLFEHAANYTGRKIVAMPPVYSVERVAHAVVRCARRPRREVMVGAAPRIMALAQLLTPRLFDAIQSRLVLRTHLAEYGEASDEGNLGRSLPPYGATGGWRPLLGARRETAT
jgi:NADP-dependent 3-hydroxy acid dehydrogenase YdfG